MITHEENEITWEFTSNHKKDKFFFRKKINGKLKEQYRPCSKEEAIIWATQAICDFELSRCQNHLEK